MIRGKISFKNIIWILFYIFVFVFLLKNSYSYLDPDLGWHLKVGESILTEKSVPHINYFNHTLEGKTWVDHEWLSDALSFSIFDNYGYFALSVFFALLMVAIFLIINSFTQKYAGNKNNNQGLIIAIEALALFGMAPHLGIRMQEITILCLLLLLIIISHYNKNKNYKILFFLFPLFYFWASAHAGFLIGIFILFFWTFIKFCEFISQKKHKFSFIDYSQKLEMKQILIFSIFSLLNVFATFLTPYKTELYSFLSGYKSAFYMTHIQEWFPQYYYPFQYWQWFYLAIAIIVVIFSIYDFQKKKIKKINFWEILLTVFFIFLAIKSKRHFPLLFIASFPIIINFLSASLDFRNIFKSLRKTKFILFLKIYLIISFLLLISILIVNINYAKIPFVNYCGSCPCGAVNYFKKNPQLNDLKIFNEYDWGGYLIWELPEMKLFIDGRLPQYEFGGQTMLEEYGDFFKKDQIEDKLKKHGIEMVLLKSRDKQYKFNWFEKYFLEIDEEETNSKPNYLREYLENNKKWKKIYKDDISSIYIYE